MRLLKFSCLCFIFWGWQSFVVSFCLSLLYVLPIDPLMKLTVFLQTPPPTGPEPVLLLGLYLWRTENWTREEPGKLHMPQLWGKYVTFLRNLSVFSCTVGIMLSFHIELSCWQVGKEKKHPVVHIKVRVNLSATQTFIGGGLSSSVWVS